MQDQAAKRRLNMSARAAEAVVKIEMAKGSIEVVPPQQADDAAAEPHAFGIARPARQFVLRFGEFVDLLRLLGGLLARPAFRPAFGVLGEGRRQCRAQDGARTNSAAHGPRAAITNDGTWFNLICLGRWEPKKGTFPRPPDWAVIEASSGPGQHDNRGALLSSRGARFVQPRAPRRLRSLASARPARLMARPCPANTHLRQTRLGLCVLCAYGARRRRRRGGGSARRSIAAVAARRRRKADLRVLRARFAGRRTRWSKGRG